jgi:hypothetical protein
MYIQPNIPQMADSQHVAPPNSKKNEPKAIRSGSPKFSPLYQFFVSHHQHITLYFFISRSGSPYIIPYTPLQL